MTVTAQGGLITWAGIEERVKGRKEPVIVNATLETRQNAFESFNKANATFLSLEAFFGAFAKKLQEEVDAKLAALQALNNELQQLKNDLMSSAWIMKGKPSSIKLTAIPDPTRGYVKNVINGDGAPLPTYPHNTDPATGGGGASGVSVKEYYLPNGAGKRMTRRNANGKLAYYYSDGSHAINQYYYTLITDDQGRPILRGNYKKHLHLEV